MRASSDPTCPGGRRGTPATTLLPVRHETYLTLIESTYVVPYERLVADAAPLRSPGGRSAAAVEGSTASRAMARSRRATPSHRRDASPNVPAAARGPARRSPRGPSRRARVERRLRVVLDAELDRLRHLRARDLRGEHERHVDAGRHAGRGDHLALLDHARLVGRRAELSSSSRASQWVVASRPSSTPAAPSSSEPVHTDVVHCEVSWARADPADQPLVVEARVRAGAAGHHHDLRVGHVLEGGVGLDAEHRRCRCGRRPARGRAT